MILTRTNHSIMPAGNTIRNPTINMPYKDRPGKSDRHNKKSNNARNK